MTPEDQIRLQNIRKDKKLTDEKVRTFQMQRLAATLGAVLLLAFYIIYKHY